MSTPAIRAALERLIELDDNCGSAGHWYAAITAARAALAAAPESAVKQSLTTAPPAPLEGEVGKLVVDMRSTASGLESHSYPQTAALIYRAATLLEQLAAAAPAVVPDGPAVPEGGEPASVVGEPSDAEVLAVRPMLEQVAAMGDCIGANTVGAIMAISDRAAAWLAENPPGKLIAIEPRGCPIPGACSCVQPAPPAEGEVGELVEFLRRHGSAQEAAGTHWARPMLRAAALLEQLSAAVRAVVPVPVSERLPGEDDCDAEGTCWVWNRTAFTWGLFRFDLTAHSHWLPAHALPLPAPQGGEGEG